MKPFRLMAILVSCITSFSVFAGSIDVSKQYARETIPGTTISSAYMNISNNQDTDIKLMSITSKVSTRIELHEHLMSDEMMQMQQVESIIVGAHGTRVLQPHGYHVMIFNLQQPLVADSEFLMTLHFDNGVDKQIKVPVIGINKKSKKH